MKAEWTNGKQKVTGYYSYNWAADSFTITLDRKDKITGRQREFKVSGDSPEWGNWRIKRAAASADRREG